jgi:hypothetical protein
MKKLVLQKIMHQQTCAVCTMFLSETASERNSKSLLLFLFHRMEFRVVFSSGEWLGTRTSSVCFYFCSTEWNYELFSLPQKGSKQNSEFASIGKEFRAFFSSAQFHGTAGIPPEQTNCYAYSNFRTIIFLSETANPSLTCIDL